MRQLFAAFSVALVAFLAAAEEVTLLTINCEWFFDHAEPHHILGRDDLPIPTEAQWRAEAARIAEVIRAQDAEIVAFQEVENAVVVEAVRQALEDPAAWHVVFDEGRDTYTGQDVALLSRYAPVPGSVTNLPEERETYMDGGEEETVNPSKILAATFEIAGEPVRVITCHLISLAGRNDAKRLAQATVVRRTAVKAMLREENVVVLGDINDLPGTPTLRMVRGLDDIWGDLLDTSLEVPVSERYSYIYEGSREQLDYILISPSLRNEFLAVDPPARCRFVDLTGISDHRGVVAQLEWE